MPYFNTTPTYRIPYLSQGETSSGISNKRQALIMDSQIQGANRLIGANGILEEGRYIAEFTNLTQQDAALRVTLPNHDIAGQSGLSLIFSSSTSGLLAFYADSSSGISQSSVFSYPPLHSYEVIIGTAGVTLAPQVVAAKIAQLLDPDTGQVQGFQTLVSGTSAFIVVEKEELIPIVRVQTATISDWVGEILIPGVITGPGRVTLRPTPKNFAMEAMIEGVYVATNDLLIWDNIPANTKAWLYAKTDEQNIYQSNEFSSLAKKQVATTWNTTGITPNHAILIAIANTTLSGIDLNTNRSGVSDNTFSVRPEIVPYNELIGQFLTLSANFSGLESNHFRGYSGYSGPSGYSGYSGRNGVSGYSGRSGYSGYSGNDGRTIFIPETLYAQFQIKFTPAQISAGGFIGSFIELVDSNEQNNPGVYVYYDFDNVCWEFDTDQTFTTIPGVVVADTWYTIDLRVHFSESSNTLFPRVDGVLGSGIAVGFSLRLDLVWLGSKYSGGLNEYYLDNLNIGTTDWGSKDIFSANFDDGNIVPPFDYIFGAGISVVSQSLFVSETNNDSYAIRYLGIKAASMSGYSGYSGANPGASGYSGYSGFSDVDRGIIVVQSGLNFVNVPFNVTFSGIPSVVAVLSLTSPAPQILTLKATTSGTTTGFTAILDNSVPVNSAYYVHWHAALP